MKLQWQPFPPKWHSDTAGWHAWADSIKKAAQQLTLHDEFRAKSGTYSGYKLDRVAFVRDDYSFRTNHFSIYAYDTNKNIFVGFGHHQFTSVPTLILTNHAGMKKFLTTPMPPVNEFPKT